MSMDYIRNAYRVGAKRGGRIIYTSSTGQIMGTIIGSSGQYLKVRPDGGGRTLRLHPTWNIEYVDAEKETDDARKI